MNVATSFKILEIGKDSDMADLKRAYRCMAKKCHPDRFHHDPLLKKRAESRMQEINLAFKVASDFFKSLKMVEKQRMAKNRSKMSAASSDRSQPDHSDMDQPDQEQSQKERYSDSYKKTQNSVLRFFYWCQNMMAYPYSRSQRGDNSSSEENLSSTANSSSNSEPLADDSVASASMSEKGGSPHKSAASSDASDRYKERKKTSFEFMLKKSRDSLDSGARLQPERSEERGCNIRGGDKSDKSCASANDRSIFQYVKRKKKFMDSYSGPVEKISPISRVNRI